MRAALAPRLRALPEREYVEGLRNLLLTYIGEQWRAPAHNVGQLTPNQVVEVQAWLEAGDLQREIADCYGVSLATIKRIARRMHPKAPRPDLAPELRAEIRRLHNLGLPISRIAETLGMPYSRVRDTVTTMPPGWSCPDIAAAAEVSA